MTNSAMKSTTPIESMSLRYHQGQLLLLDQSILPKREEWIEIKNHKDMIRAIRTLKVRGAPLIGVAAAFSLAQTIGHTKRSYHASTSFIEDFHKAALELRAARPTAINLMVAIEQILSMAQKDFTHKSIEETALRLFHQDMELCQKIAENGAALIPDGSSILTHCNTGGLATTGVGTALGAIAQAHKQGKKIHVYVNETRPLLQGGRLTTWELDKQGIPYTLICDNMSASLMAEGRISLTMVGADRIARNGDFANKVGTYNIALCCHYHRIPFYMAAPHTTIDFQCSTGKDIPIEERDPKEVSSISYGSQKSHNGHGHIQVHNPAFDVTPSNLVQGWILNTGVLTPQNWEIEFKILEKKYNILNEDKTISKGI